MATLRKTTTKQVAADGSGLDSNNASIDAYTPLSPNKTTPIINVPITPNSNSNNINKTKFIRSPAWKIRNPLTSPPSSTTNSLHGGASNNNSGSRVSSSCSLLLWNKQSRRVLLCWLLILGGGYATKLWFRRDSNDHYNLTSLRLHNSQRDDAPENVARRNNQEPEKESVKTNSDAAAIGPIPPNSLRKGGDSHSTTTRLDNKNVIKLVNQSKLREPHEFDSSYLSSTVIFYSIHVPSTASGQAIVLRAVREQLDQIKTSYAAQLFAGQALTVLYLTVGTSDVITSAWMRDACRGGPHTTLLCRPLEHLNRGYRTSTLSHLSKHCLRPERHDSSTARVIYLHNFGRAAFRTHDALEHWRYALTAAPLSEHCLNRTLPASCNVCGLTFYTQWAPLFRGNMFTATCDYISQLVPPRDFNNRLVEGAFREMLEMRIKERLVITYKNKSAVDQKEWFALDRDRDEFWVASHPNVRPCDCDPVGNLSYYQQQRRSVSDLQGAVAPRTPGSPLGRDWLDTELLQRNASLRFREYHYLPGQLHRWYFLYQKPPPPESWAWTWFPDGAVWKKAVEEHGRHAIYIITEQYMDPEYPIQPAFAKGRLDTSKFSHHPADKPGIFFHWHAPNRRMSTREMNDILKTAREQIDIVASSATASQSASSSKQPLYYVTMGPLVMSQAELCPKSSKSLKCHHLAHYSVEIGETLRNVKEFCQLHPTQQVVYLHNTAPSALANNQRKLLIMHATKAATSNLCWNAVQDADKCNVCGLAFYALPSLSMSGNMWTSSCSYINQLLPPKEFVDKSRAVVSKALIEQLKGKMTFGVFPASPERMGLDGYALNNWVGSHPTLLPCDVSKKKFSYWISKPRTGSEFALQYGPHFPDAPFDYDEKADKEVRADDARRMSEFHFLVGNLMKWFAFYNDAPRSSSWVWSFFPDGQVWSKELAAYGRRKVPVA